MATGPSACALVRTATHSAASGRGSPAPFTLPQGTFRRCRRRRQHVQKAAACYADLLHTLAPALADHLVLAYERVVLPCSSINCGDVMHRSTLDPVLRLEQRGIDPKAVLVAVVSLLYLTLQPGVLQGAWDYYISARYQRLANTTPYNEESFLIGKKLAAGGFGTVYRADLIKEDNELQPVIVKKAKEFGEAEVWMNERLMRVAPGSFAKFVTAFEEQKAVPKPGTQMTRQDSLLWLVWQYEGNDTLWDVMQKRDFPYNLEPLLLGRTLDIAKSHRRRLISIRLILRQVLEGLAACHETGIVHRDVKPQNVIMSTVDNRAKLIDLGAAADLRVGINYVPSEFLLDPRYAPPQQYIMSTSTPRAPPLPVAALLSPILWRLNTPDRFDMFSVGILLLQMAFPSLRSDNNLIAFRRRLEQCNFDMAQWRRFFERRSPREASEGFELLDLNDGALWDLTLRLMAYNPGDRISASEALQHPAFGRSALSRAVRTAVNAGGEALQAVGGKWVADALGGSGREGTLTEARLSDELGPGNDLPGPMRRARTTISWWQARQGALNRASADRKAKLERQLARTKSTSLDSDVSSEEDVATGNGAANGNGKAVADVKVSKKKARKLLPWLSTTQ